MDIGCYPAGIDQVSEAVAADFRAATFSSHPDEAIGRWKNRKLLTNLGNAIEAVCGPHERLGPLGDTLLAEGEAVLSAAGLEAATAEEDRTRRADLLQPGEIAGQTRPGGPSWQSLRCARRDSCSDDLGATRERTQTSSPVHLQRLTQGPTCHYLARFCPCLDKHSAEN